MKPRLAYTGIRKRLTSTSIKRWLLGVVFVLVLSPLLSTVYTYTRGGEGARVHAATSSTLNFQARLLNASGALVADGNYSVQFKLYDAVSGGTNEWTETQTVVLKNGYLSANLGNVTPFTPTIDWTQEKWLTMNVNADGEMTPRIKLTGVPFAFRAGLADALSITGGSITGDDLLQKGPGSVQSLNSANAGLRFNQTGAGGLIQLQGNGLDVFTVDKTGNAVLAGGLTLGNSSSTSAGTLRWTGIDFEGFNGADWVSLTSGSGGGGNSNATASFTSGLANAPANGTGTVVELMHFTTATAVSNIVGTTEFIAPAGGSFRTCLVSNNAAITGGTLNLRWRVNGASVGAGACTMNATTNRESSGVIDPGVVTFSAGDTISIAFDTVALAPITVDFTVYWTVEYNSTVGGGGGTSFVQNGNSFGSTAVLGTTDNFGLNFITNNAVQLSVDASGNLNVQNGNVSTNGISRLTNAGALQNITSLTLSSGAISGVTTITASGAVTAGSFSGSGSGITALNASNISSGTLNDAQLSGNVALLNAAQSFSVLQSFDAGITLGNTAVNTAGNLRWTGTDFEGYDGAIWKSLTAGGSGSGLEFVQSGNSFGATAVIGTTDNFGLDFLTNNIVQLSLDSSGNMNLLNGDLSTAGTVRLTNAGALQNITSLTLSSGAISGVTTINASSTVTADSFIGDGSGLTLLSADNIFSGTLNDARLSANVALLNATQTFSVLNTFSAGIVLGNTAATTAGTIRWTGTDFEGYDGTDWVSFTSGGGATLLEGTLAIGKVAANGTALNISGATVARNSIGNYTVTLDTAVSNSNYTVQLTAEESAGVLADVKISITNQTINGFTVLIHEGNDASSTDNLVDRIWHFVAFDPDATAGGPSGPTGNAFEQNGNAFGSNAILGTTDNYGLSFITAGNTALTIDNAGSVSFTNDVTVGAGLVVTAGGINVTGNSTISGTLDSIMGLTFVSGNIDLSGGGIINTGALAGVTTITASGAILAATSVDTINGLIINAGAISGITGMTFTSGALNLNNGGITNAGALSGVTSISASGAITAATSTNTINGLVINSGELTSVTGITFTSGNLVLGGGDITGAGSINGVSLNVTGAISAATSLNTINGLVINSGSLTAVTGYSQTTGAFSVTGNGSVTIGAGSNVLTIDSTAFDVSSTGALSGITTINASSTITANTTGTINGLNISSGSLSGITGFSQSSGVFAISGTGSFSTGTGAISLNGAVTTASTLTSTGLATFNGGATIQTGDTLTVNGEGFTDLTGSGLILSGTTLAIDVATAGTVAGTGSNSGLVVAADGVSLLRGCNNNQILKWANGGGGVWNCAADGVSDARLKKNIESVDMSVLSRIRDVNLYSFDYDCNNPAFQTMHCDTDHQAAGVMAQELMQLFPELVTEVNGHYEVRYDKLSLYNLKAVGELANNVDVLSANTQHGEIVTNGTLRMSSQGVLQNINGLNMTSGGASIVGGLNNNNGGITSVGSLSGVTGISAQSITLSATGNNNLLTLTKDGNGVFTVFNTGALQLQLDSANALAVKAVNGDSVLNVDTLTGRVKIGSGNNGKTVLFALDTKSTAGDPEGGTNGSQYYNSDSDKFRCYQAGEWQDCVQTSYSEYTVMSTPSPWAAQPSADTEFPLQNRTWIELRNANYFRILSNLTVAGAPNATCRIQYGSNTSNSEPDWHDLSSADDKGAIHLNGTGALKSQWSPVAKDGKKESLVRVMCKDGDSQVAPNFTSIRIQVR